MTQAFNLSQLANKVNTSGQLDVATGVTGTQAVANGGTGQSTYTDGQLLIGNTTGNTLTKATLTAGTGISVTNGSGSITIANTSTGGQLQTQLFTAPGTWTCPATTTQVRVTVVGGGQGATPASGGFGGLACAISPVSTPVAVTVGAGGGGGAPSGPSGGTSSFGALVSATGGSAPTPGTGTVSTGTALRTGNISGSAPAVASYGLFNGTLRRTAAGATPYTTSSTQIAGAAATAGNTTYGGVGGAVLVEFVG
jgi:hypothetical protein